MRRVVVDASVAAKWILPEPYSDTAALLLAEDYELWAPDLLWPEVGNILWKKWRRGEITAEEGGALLQDFRHFPVQLHSSVGITSIAWEIASSFSRSFYDSLYLALAVDRDCALVTADGKLYNALSGGSSPVPLIWVAEIY
ncbi:MAG: type II toxin-antitoxin system VapC family toxin [Acidobacteriota bacterium]